ncbi:hypothetical protein BD311DRAFT_787940 [Dichomitus squalens]|uniref:Uncharacterized protein n=1 Tax=Dichomitus squalens TaxID=114155 RepID=A0A4Q9MQ42_9APHY|nr:hypothetical protein BD311DRAFT_787940 [Dichomitus squalens]
MRPTMAVKSRIRDRRHLFDLPTELIPIEPLRAQPTPPGRRDEPRSTSPPPLPLACTARTATRGLVPGGGAYVFAFPGPAAVASQLLEGYRDLRLPASGAREHASRAAPARPPGADRRPAGLFVLKAEDESDVLEKGNDEFLQAPEEWEEAAVRDHEEA